MNKENKNSKYLTQNLNPKRLWKIFAFGLILQLLLWGFSEQKIPSGTNLLVTAIFWGALFYIFRWMNKIINFCRTYQTSFETITSQILEREKISENDILEEILDKSISFDNPELESLLDEYRKDVIEARKLKPGYRGDIEEYFNYDFMDKAFENEFLSVIPSTMTGLGILGTFVGLAIGLNAFDISGNAEEVEAKIVPLMNGIKTAFHTSIIGLIYSLLLNKYLSKQKEMFERSLNAFVDVYNKHVIKDYIAGNTDTSDKYQKKIEYVLLQQLQISSELNNAIKALAENSQKSQSEKMGEIVDAFIAQMNTSLGDTFTELRAIIEETNKWQKTALEEMSKVMTEVNLLTVDLAKVNDQIATTVDTVKEYTDDIHVTQEKVVENLDVANNILKTNNEISTKQETVLQNISDEYKKTVAELDKFIKMVGENSDEQYKKLEEAIDDYFGRVDEIHNYAIKNIEKIAGDAAENLNGAFGYIQKSDIDISESTDRLYKVINNINNNMEARVKETFAEFDTELAQITRHFSGTIKQMDDSIDKVPILVNETYGDMEQKLKEIQVHIDSYLEYADKLHHNIEAKWNQFNSYESERK